MGTEVSFDWSNEHLSRCLDNQDALAAAFAVADSDGDGLVGSADAASFFRASGLQDHILAYVWKSCARDGQGLTSQDALRQAFKLILGARANKLSGSHRSGSMFDIELARKAVHAVLGQFQGVEAVVKEVPEEDKDNYGKYFKKLVGDEEVDELERATAARFFSRSGLQETLVNQIVDQLIPDKDEDVDQLQFSAIMFIIQRVLSNVKQHQGSKSKVKRIRPQRSGVLAEGEYVRKLSKTEENRVRVLLSELGAELQRLSQAPDLHMETVIKKLKAVEDTIRLPAGSDSNVIRGRHTRSNSSGGGSEYTPKRPVPQAPALGKTVSNGSDALSQGDEATFHSKHSSDEQHTVGETEQAIHDMTAAMFGRVISTSSTTEELQLAANSGEAAVSAPEDLTCTATSQQLSSTAGKQSTSFESPQSNFAEQSFQEVPVVPASEVHPELNRAVTDSATIAVNQTESEEDKQRTLGRVSSVKAAIAAFEAARKLPSEPPVVARSLSKRKHDEGTVSPAVSPVAGSFGVFEEKDVENTPQPSVEVQRVGITASQDPTDMSGEGTLKLNQQPGTLIEEEVDESPAALRQEIDDVLSGIPHHAETVDSPHTAEPVAEEHPTVSDLHEGQGFSAAGALIVDTSNGAAPPASDSWAAFDSPKKAAGALAVAATSLAAPAVLKADPWGSEDPAPEVSEPAGFEDTTWQPQNKKPDAQEVSPEPAGFEDATWQPQNKSLGTQEVSPESAGFEDTTWQPQNKSLGTQEVSPQPAGFEDTTWQSQNKNFGTQEVSPEPAGFEDTTWQPQNKSLGTQEVSPEPASFEDTTWQPQNKSLGTQEVSPESSATSELTGFETTAWQPAGDAATLPGESVSDPWAEKPAVPSDKPSAPAPPAVVSQVAVVPPAVVSQAAPSDSWAAFSPTAAVATVVTPVEVTSSPKALSTERPTVTSAWSAPETSATLQAQSVDPWASPTAVGRKQPSAADPWAEPVQTTSVGSDAWGLPPQQIKPQEADPWASFNPEVAASKDQAPLAGFTDVFADLAPLGVQEGKRSKQNSFSGPAAQVPMSLSKAPSFTGTATDPWSPVDPLSLDATTSAIGRQGSASGNGMFTSRAAFGQSSSVAAQQAAPADMTLQSSQDVWSVFPSASKPDLSFGSPTGRKNADIGFDGFGGNAFGSSLTPAAVMDTGHSWTSSEPGSATQSNLSTVNAFDNLMTSQRVLQPVSETACEGVDVLAWEPLQDAARLRCEQAYDEKFAQAGGLSHEEAAGFCARAKVDGSKIPAIWQAADVDKDGRLNKHEFCLLMLLIQKASIGAAIPTSIPPEQIPRLLGVVSSGPPPVRTQLSRHASRSKSLTEQEFPGYGSLSQQLKDLLQLGFSLEQAKAALDAHGGDMEKAAKALLAEGPVTSPTAGSASSSASSSRVVYNQTHSITTAAHPPLIAATGDERPVIQFSSVVLGYKKTMEQPFVTVSLRDADGNLLERPQDTPPGSYNQKEHVLIFNHSVTLTTPLTQIPAGSTIFFEVKHYKTKEKKISMAAWSFLPTGLMLNFEEFTPRLKVGPMQLPLYQKPLEVSLNAKRMKRINPKSKDMQIVVGLV